MSLLGKMPIYSRHSAGAERLRGIAVAKGKKLYDKRNDIKEKDIKRELQRSFK